MQHKRKLWLVAVITAAVFLSAILSGCSADPDKVPLSNKSDILAYSKTQFGPCLLIEAGDEEGTGEDRAIHCTMEDKEYGFRYDVTSHIVKSDLDGMRWYSEEKTSNFYTKYLSELTSEYNKKFQEMEQTYECTISFNMDGEASDFVAEIASDKEPKACAEALAQIIMEFDTRKYLSNKVIAGYDAQKLEQESEERAYWGSAHLSDGLWWSEKQETSEFYMNIVREELNDETITCSKTETRPIESIVNVNDAILWTIDGIAENATLYYFTVDNEEYWVSDVRIRTENGETTFANNYQGAAKVKEDSEPSFAILLLKMLLPNAA